MIQIKNLDITFDQETIYNNFSVELKRGENVAIAGASGKGKTTLLNVLAGFVPHFKGSITINNKPITPKSTAQIRKQIAYLPQDMTILTETVEGTLYAPFAFKANKQNKPSQAEVKQLLHAFALSEQLLTKKFKEISGGEKQRILLASTVLQKKPILLLDEPTSALDAKIKEQVTNYVLTTQHHKHHRHARLILDGKSRPHS